MKKAFKQLRGNYEISEVVCRPCKCKACERDIPSGRRHYKLVVPAQQAGVHVHLTCLAFSRNASQHVTIDSRRCDNHIIRVKFRDAFSRMAFLVTYGGNPQWDNPMTVELSVTSAYNSTRAVKFLLENQEDFEILIFNGHEFIEDKEEYKRLTDNLYGI